MQSNLIKLNSLTNYLLSRNWTWNKVFPNKKLKVFNKFVDEHSDPLTIVIPSNETFQDYIPRVQSVVETLAAFEGVSKEQVIRDITSMDIDKLEIRVVSTFAEDGSIPLSYASNLIDGLKNLIVSAAYSEENPKRSFKRPSQKALSYSDSFKLGQTAVGSYVVTVESGPLLDDHVEMVIDNHVARTEPFSRRVMRRIHKAMHQIESFNKENYKLSDLINEGYNDGLNANICEALLSLYFKEKPVKLESRINYSWIVEVEGETLPDLIILDNDDYHSIKVIAEALRNEEPESLVIEGTISRLSISSGSQYGIINVSATYENKKHSVKIALEEEDYKLACDAHKNNKRVRVTGKMDSSGRTWEIIDLEGFDILMD
ncbi:hypothetical protein J2T16_001685 [Paenibacillus intestini]|uniref:DUF4935 domain-containing protein n=1 Tax=Paenibacillus cucumis (ex Kampfer et al. 2016) TaxID=1776858 RepID=A0ABS7KCB4_9BACL|nr:hypothetical protein [Paenibacillus cucumis (ex Kampfer et al. 2016)]MBY0201779.1 hypothetical protein [Paenibacillus cucumis (ex Kampfer et al. 2016)]MDP9698788.1 hypothetical protein [Paenibacillus intestini]